MEFQKWITGGTFADFFTVAVRTGGSGMGGISMLLVERSEGLSTRHMACQGLWSGGTAYLLSSLVRSPCPLFSMKNVDTLHSRT